MSRCPRSDCEGTSFELKEIKVRDARFRHYAIQCTTCGAVVSIQEYWNLGLMLEKISKKLGIPV